MRRLYPIVLALWLAGCGVVPTPGPAPDLFDLSPKNTFNGDLPKVIWQLVIEEPLAAGGLDTNRIALRPGPTEIKYFADVRWAERAPKMIQTLLVESFENTNSIVAVGRQAIGLRSDVTLKTELREFQAEYFTAEQAPDVRVRLNAKLIHQRKQIIIASRTFEVVKTADGTSIRQIIVAFDDALGKVLRRIVEWTLTTPDIGA